MKTVKTIFALLCILFFTSSLSQSLVPNTQLKDLKKELVYTDDVFNEDKFYVVSFWATWCIPCINELDAINELYDSWNKNYNIKVLAISTDDARSKKRVRPMVSGKNWVFDVYLDTNQNFKRSLNISGIPHTIIAYGSKIIHRRIGYSPGEEKDLLKVISNYKQK